MQVSCTSPSQKKPPLKFNLVFPDEKAFKNLSVEQELFFPRYKYKNLRSCDK